MDEQRDKLPEPESAEPADEKASPALPEGAEIIEIVDEEPSFPSAPSAPSAPTPPGPARVEPDFPEEALEQIRNLRAQLERKDKQIEQVMEAYRSTKAETEKLRERISKTERRRFEQSKGDFIARFVEVLDNLDRAIDSIEQSFDADAVLQGIMLVRSRLVQLLKTEGLEKIFVRGQTFDPTHSEAAETETVSDEEQDGVVVKELQPGYMLKGSLLRAARVVVGQFGQEPEPALDDVIEVPSLEAPEPVAAEPPPDAADETLVLEEDTEEGQGDDWEADASGHELQFTEDGFDFSKE